MARRESGMSEISGIFPNTPCNCHVHLHKKRETMPLNPLISHVTCPCGKLALRELLKRENAIRKRCNGPRSAVEVSDAVLEGHMSASA